MPALERCVGDVTAFFDRHWGSAPLLTESGSSFDDLASLDDLDAMVASLGLDAASLRMVKEGKTFPPEAYTASSAGRVGRALVNAGLVYRNYQDGATIVLESLHRYWRPLTDFCRALELALGHRLQVNAYLTPPGSRGFDVHRDSHDVFVLQVSGSKHWVVYDRDDDERVLIDRPIERGASLYIPAGFPHAARTGRGASAHLTVGILTHDSGDVVRELSQLASEQPAFRERLDLRGVHDAAGLRTLVELEVDQLRVWLDKLDLDDLTERVARRVVSTAQPVTRGLLSQLERLEGLGAETRLHRRPGSVCMLFPRDTTLKVLLTDRELEMPAVARPAMERIADRDSFAVSDLHDVLDEESALVLVRRLVREGLLEVED